MHLRGDTAIGEVGLVQPIVEYLFELELPAGFVPKPHDHEAESFKLLDVDEIKAALLEGTCRFFQYNQFLLPVLFPFPRTD